MPDFDATYFEENYADYSAQNSAGKLRHYHTAIRDRVDVDGPVRVLDVGCGLGLWADYLARAEPQWSVVAIDVDPDVISSNQQRFQTVTFTVGRAGEGIPDERFDVITAMDVLEHVPAIEQRFADVCKWLKPGGLLALVVPVYDGALGPVVRLLDHDPTHIHKWSRNQWLELAAEHLSDIEWHGLFRIMPPVGGYLHFPAKTLRRIAPAVMITGRTPPARSLQH